MSRLSSIQSEHEYEAALNEASIFFDNEPAIGSQEAIRFELLLNLIETYEAKHYPIDSPNMSQLV
jgi:HTH-type transcriptional regulator / antitoxin HigA